MLIIGFCGVGKTTYASTHKNAVDLTCVEPGQTVLQDAISRFEIVLADPSWLMTFVESGLPFYVVVPSMDLKDEYLANYRERHKRGTGGGDDRFCEFISGGWEEWIETLKKVNQTVVELGPGEFLEDAISYLSQCRNG